MSPSCLTIPWLFGRACMAVAESVTVFLITGLTMALMVLAIMACDLYEPANGKQDEPHYLYYYEL